MSSVSTELSKIQGRQIEFIATAFDAKLPNSGHSNFRYLADFSRRRRLPAYIPPLIRVFSLARKLGFQGLLVDSISSEVSPFLVEENQVLAQKESKYARSEIVKFSFFKKSSECQIVQNDFLGYAVFKIDYDTEGQPLCYHIFESVFPLQGRSLRNNFLQCKRCYSVSNTFGDNFEVSGALYAQQNKKTFFCAHVALRSVLSCILPKGDISYYEISQLAGTRDGLTEDNIDQVFTGLNVPFRKVIFQPCPHNSKCQFVPSPSYIRELYGFTESTCPVLLGFESTNGNGHIVPVFGHTFNEDSWVPPSNQVYFQKNTFRFFSSEQWLSSHIIHDDNFGPYYCLPRQFLSQENFRSLYGINFRKPALYSVEAEAAAIDLFKQIAAEIKERPHDDPWMDIFLVFTGANRLILRSIYLSKEKYRKHLQNSLQGHIHAQWQKIAPILPDHFWMVEASMPELFSVSRKKFGEIILAVDVNNNDEASFNLCFIRLPNCAIVRDKDNNTLWSSWPSWQLPTRGHTPIYMDDESVQS